MNRRRCITGAGLLCSLLAIVILALAFAHAWAPPTTIAGHGARCFDDFAHSKWPMWLGCAIAAHETLAGGLIAAAGVLFGAWLAFSGLREQIATEQQNIRTLQRAYISVEPLGIEPFYSAGGVPDNVVGHVQFRNVGHLPAQNLQLSPVRLKWVALIKDEVLKFDGTDPSQKFVLPIQAKMPLGSETLSSEDFERVVSKKGYLLVWGKVTYIDGFRTPRFVNFCHTYPCIRLTGDNETGYRISKKHARYHRGNDQN